jgi:predicted DNA-binding transcriptional regulator YafY
MSNSLHRHWLMLQEIPRSPNKIDAASIRVKLNQNGYSISKRSVERDLKDLAETGIFPIEKDDRTKPYGWYWPRNIKPINIPGMDNMTALAYVLLEQHTAELLPASISQCIKPYFQHARAVLDSSNSNNLSTWPDKIRLLNRGPIQKSPPIDEGIASTVQAALLADRKIELLYSPRGSVEPVNYEVSPLALVFKAGVVYLVCTIGGSEKPRLLALHRAVRAYKLASSSEGPEGFDLDEYILEGHLSFTRSKKTINLKAIISDFLVLHLSEQPLSSNQVIDKRRDGFNEISVSLADTDELRWWILSFGVGIEVLKPASLRKEIKATAGSISEMYKD